MSYRPSAMLVYGLCVADTNGGFLPGVQEVIEEYPEETKGDIHDVIERYAKDHGLSYESVLSPSYDAYILCGDEKVRCDGVGITEFDDLPIPTQEQRAELARLTSKLNSSGLAKEHHKAQWILAVLYF